MFVLNTTAPYQDPMSVSGDLVHVHDTFTFLSSFPRAEIKVTEYPEITNVCKVTSRNDTFWNIWSSQI